MPALATVLGSLCACDALRGVGWGCSSWLISAGLSPRLPSPSLRPCVLLLLAAGQRAPGTTWRLAGARTCEQPGCKHPGVQELRESCRLVWGEREAGKRVRQPRKGTGKWRRERDFFQGGEAQRNRELQDKFSSFSLVKKKMNEMQVLLCSKCKLIMCKVLMLLKQNTWRGSPGCWSRA